MPTLWTYFGGRNILFLSFLENPCKLRLKPTKPGGKFTDPFDLVLLYESSQDEQDKIF